MDKALDETETKDRGWRGSATLWLEGAHAQLIEGGVEAVKIGPLAARLGLSRTSFYWHFADREALLSALIDRWRETNSAGLVARIGRDYPSITSAILALFDAWVDGAIFDSAGEFAMRNWALTDSEVERALQAEDQARIVALTDLFLRHGFSAAESDTRARTVYLTQIGYITIKSVDPWEARMARIANYVLVFTGQNPSAEEVAAFQARHGIK